MPVSGLTLTASAAAFRSGSKNASILVIAEIDGGGFRFVEKGGSLWDEIEMVTLPFDAAGNPRSGTRDLIAITPRPQTRDQILANGIRMTKRLELAPGRYQLRIGAREAGTGQVGSVLLDLDVPDFGKGPLSMSGLALATPGANGMVTARPDEQLKDVLPAPPTVTRAFIRDEQLSLFTEIYDQIRAAHRLQITTTVTGDDGKVAFEHRDERNSSELRAAGDAFGHVATIPLKGFAAGRYVLRVEARPLLSAGGPVFREVELTVR